MSAANDLVSRVQRLAARQAGEQDARAARNRLRFPEHAAVLDAFRTVFGPGVRWAYLYDADGSMGRPGPPGVPLSDWQPPDQRKQRGKR